MNGREGTIVSIKKCRKKKCSELKARVRGLAVAYTAVNSVLHAKVLPNEAQKSAQQKSEKSKERP